MRKGRFCLLWLLAIANGTSIAIVNADSTTTTNVSANGSSTASTSSTLPKWVDHLTSTYVGVYTGGSLATPGTSYSPNTSGKPDPALPQQLENYLGLFYKIMPTVKVGAQAHFFYSPVDRHNVTMMDPLVQITDTAIVDTGRFKIAGYARAYLPVSQESNGPPPTGAGPDRLLQFRFFLNPAYDVTNRLNVGLYTYAQPAFYGSNGQGATFLGYVGPNLNYQVSQTVALTALYEMAMTHTKGKGSLTDFDNAGTDFEPGVNWDITPQLSVNPFLNIYTGNQISWANTSVNMYVVGKLF